MDKGKVVENDSLGQIPEVVDPRVALPLYEDELSAHDPSQPQKLGSYRTRAGKFSNTLSNLLPSISAKLHHSRKASGAAKNGTETANTRSPSTNTTTSSQVSLAGHVTPPGITAQDGTYPDGTYAEGSYLVHPPRRSDDSFTFGTSVGLHPTASNTISRTRNNTVSSQITSPSGAHVWSTTTSPNEQQPLVTMTGTGFNPSPLNEYSSNTYFDLHLNNMGTAAPLPGGQNSITNHLHGNNTSNLAVPVSGGNVWGNRPRSYSNSSSIYTDAPIYDNLATNRSRASTFGLGLDQSQMPNLNGVPIKHTHSSSGPLVADDVDPRSINWVTMDLSVPAINQISNLLPTNTVSISNVVSLQSQQPQLSNAINLTSTSLATLCMKFGTVSSARTFKGVNMAIVEFDSVEAAVRAKDALHGKEVSLVGAPSTVSFAKILPMHQQSVGGPQNSGSGASAGPQSLLQEQLYSGAVSFQQQGNLSIPVLNNTQSNQSNNHSTTHVNNEKEQCPFALPPPNVMKNTKVLGDIIASFTTSYDASQTKHIVENALRYDGTADTGDFGPLPDPIPNREFDAPKLREIRKAIDANSLKRLEIEQLAVAMLDELPELCSDYLGNTIVQKLFEHSSTIIKDLMLRQTNKFLTSMGVHKNGTWACQKIITMADTPRQRMLIAEGVKRYCTPLFNDQFGNYVIQCVLKFGFPWNNFIFENIVSNFWTIAQNRYGARAVRACLEAHDIITREQILVLSGMIVLYAEYLATNSNGALLVTWFLDTCTLPHRHAILAPRLVSNIVELCCHRLASLTVLKVLNCRGDDKARRLILDSIFGKRDSTDFPQVLYQILCDSNYGPTFLHKVLSMSLLEGEVRLHVVQQVRRVLSEINVTQMHRRLMEEVGLGPNSITASMGSNSKHRPSVSHLLGNDSSGHMRNLSVSSALSNSSRPRALSSGGISQMAMSGSQPGQSLPVASIPANLPPQPNLSVPGGYYNYPGVFPVNTGAPSAYPVTGDDLSSQLEMLALNNGTQISLPQLSMAGNKNPNLNNKPNASKSGSNNYGMYGY
ncbi:LAMI_0H03532g1_1 [Lachancea mirantina]|uniref:LAMI_0H03532g1_1 n=1 Tax=Lachancea mirantina TaxID=1230905 RepID=A0A1G4KEM3_9SACH|nr:LAMI_0H03532g1_1 [Lachancea mirantina]